MWKPKRALNAIIWGAVSFTLPLLLGYLGVNGEWIENLIDWNKWFGWLAAFKDAAQFALTGTAILLAIGLTFLGVVMFNDWREARREEKLRKEREPETLRRDAERDSLLIALDEILSLIQGRSFHEVENNISRLASLDDTFKNYGLGSPLAIDRFGGCLGYYLPLRPHLELGIQEAQEWKRRIYDQQEDGEPSPRP